MGCQIVFIGAGNLATHLSLAFKEKNFSICQVYSRTDISAKNLAKKLNSGYTTDTKKITSDADIYFVALNDDVYDEVLPFINFGNKLIVHCSGSMPLSAISEYSKNTGVFYPLQTFSKQRHVDFSKIPVFVEADSKDNENLLLHMAGKISHVVKILDSQRRLYIHIAAIFACNFVNYLYSVASDIINSKEISFDVLKALILETAMKVQEMEPFRAQTGPAVRFDHNTILRHLKALEDFPEYRELYDILSLTIYKHYNINR
jgi:predicted short-subunit dehydrogenase-like oxidoreductase (DUF2520 family)